MATSQIFKEQNIRAVVDLEADVPPLFADHDRLIQVMLNLLSNAAKFCDKQHGLVEIRLRREADALRVDVHDNGPGINPENQQIVFEKFRQVGDTLTDKPQGTGLGLPICRQIIGHFGGRLWVESRPGEGATFSFTLPIAVADPLRQTVGAIGA